MGRPAPVLHVTQLFLVALCEGRDRALLLYGRRPGVRWGAKLACGETQWCGEEALGLFEAQLLEAQMLSRLPSCPVCAMALEAAMLGRVTA